MSDYNDEYLAGNLANDELWGSVPPRYQVALLADIRAQAQLQLSKFNDRMEHDKMDRSEREILSRKRFGAARFLNLIQMRTVKAKLALSDENLKRAESEAFQRYKALCKVIEHHQKVTEETPADDQTGAIADADELLYKTLEEVRTGKYDA